MSKRLIRLSRLLSHALRHRPAQYGLTLDGAGWVAIDDLVAAVAGKGTEWHALSVADIHDMMAAADKQRYEISGPRIRAVYGHSVSGRIEHIPANPPDTLYHGTTPASLAKIRVEGLKPMGRQYVHLSPDIPNAVAVANRRTGNPAIILIMAGRAHGDGIAFYRADERVWLAEEIAPKYLRLPDDQ